MKYQNIREEALKNKVAADWFHQFDATAILGNIDFCVTAPSPLGRAGVGLLWAEAKTGNFDVATMFVQLILTIGKARTFDKTLPPAFLGAFDFKKIAFVPYSSVQDIFYMNDFNWNATPSNHETKEFALIKNRIEATLKANAYVYDYQADEKELIIFIKNNIAQASETSKIQIDKNNFVPIYLRWLQIIKPNIDVNWDDLKKTTILDSDFYLADLFVDDKDTPNISDDSSVRRSLFVFFENEGYKIARENMRQILDYSISIKNKEVYQEFWKRYKRPPIEAFQDYIIERRDLLVPQDIRERKGAFFTPQIWVELSQKYLADTLGQNWQDEYYIWDCAAGTGNLLAGLTNPYSIWASTLDQADVKVMHERIEHGANLLENHCFQFDFLNDDFTKLPQDLQAIINDPEKRKKLVIYINPPYADASSNMKTSSKVGNSFNKTHEKYKAKLSSFGRELFAQFLIRIYVELPECKVAEFSKTKLLTVSHAKVMRSCFLAKLEKIFVVPASTFDNVKGQFPIGFKIWSTNKKEKFEKITADVFNASGGLLGTKTIYSFDNEKKINKWLKEVKEDINGLGYLSMGRNDFQNNNLIFIINLKSLATNYSYPINVGNLIKVSIYFAAQKVIKATWLNDRDQFLFPNEGWQSDAAFQNDCLAYTIFSNNIQTKFGTNHWIPFIEQEVNAKEKFKSNFMTDFINGKLVVNSETVELFSNHENLRNSGSDKLHFSIEATAVFDAGRMIWRYYHAQKFKRFEGIMPIREGIYDSNSSLYDIRAYFQGRNDAGRMNNKSTDVNYTKLMSNLREAMEVLAEKIAPKVYEYEFLKP